MTSLTIKYCTLSGLENDIIILSTDKIIDLIQKIKKKENLREHIQINLIDNNIIKHDNDSIDNTKYIIIYHDILQEFKDQILHHETILIPLKSIINIIDSDLLILFKNNIQFLLNQHIFKNYKHFNYYICTNVIKHSDLTVVKQLYKSHFIVSQTRNIILLATYNPNFDVFTYLIEVKHYKLNIEMYYYSIFNNNLSIIKYLIHKKFYFNFFVYCIAIQYDKLDIIIYFDSLNLLNKPFNFGHIVCIIAYFYKSVKCAKYFNDLGYTLSIITIQNILEDRFSYYQLCNKYFKPFYPITKHIRLFDKLNGL